MNLYIMDKIKYSLYFLIIGNLIGYNDFYNNNPLDQNVNYNNIITYNTRKINIDFFKLYGGFNNYDYGKKNVNYTIYLIICYLQTITKFKTFNDIDFDNFILYFYDNLNKLNDDYNIISLNIQLSYNLSYFNFNQIIIYNILNKYLKPYSYHNLNITLTLYFTLINTIFFNEVEFNKLLIFNINISRYFNNKPFIYIGCIILSLFITYIFKKIDIKDWIFNVIEYLENNDLENVIYDLYKKTYKNEKDFINNISNFKEDKNKVLGILKKYILFRFDDKNNIKIYDFLRYYDLRIFYFINNFSEQQNNYYYTGCSVIETLIIIYDSLIESNNNFELLIQYSNLYYGNCCDSGSISLVLFYLLYDRKYLIKNIYKKEFIFKNEINLLMNLHY